MHIILVGRMHIAHCTLTTTSTANISCKPIEWKYEIAHSVHIDNWNRVIYNQTLFAFAYLYFSASEQQTERKTSLSHVSFQWMDINVCVCFFLVAGRLTASYCTDMEIVRAMLVHVYITTQIYMYKVWECTVSFSLFVLRTIKINW